MHSDWTVACAADDPEIVIPWSGKNPALRFIDLRQSPETMQDIPEAAEYPCVAAALRRWNQQDTITADREMRCMELSGKTV